MARRGPKSHWWRTRLLAIAIVSVWAVVTLALPFFNSISNGTGPGGVGIYVFMAEGVLVLMLALVFWFARRQQAIDREFAMAEED
ncbi:hypothetical protein MNBD_ALPHA09-2135 [hydrothermal vent metagenome]|uniref:Sodium symporter small subunit domain-containing protein n=1 Tax=hydrothermal vent metagenome TaxID=652676 RepID=A0A3B0T550_9ZZZZ